MLMTMLISCNPRSKASSASYWPSGCVAVGERHLHPREHTCSLQQGGSRLDSGRHHRHYGHTKAARYLASLPHVIVGSS